MVQRIILRNIIQPKKINLNDDIEWITNTFGFCAGRDTENTINQILHQVLEEVSTRGFTSTEAISQNLNIAIQRVNYHLRTLIDSGLLYREKKQIHVRQGSLKAAVEEMRNDANRIFDNLSKIAETIDEELGFQNR